MPPRSSTNNAASELIIKLKHGKRNIFIPLQPKSSTIAQLKQELSRALNDTIANKSGKHSDTTTTLQEVQEDGADTIKATTTTTTTTADETNDGPVDARDIFLALPIDKNNPAAGFIPIIDSNNDDDDDDDTQQVKRASKIADLGISDYGVIAYKIGENDSFTIEIPSTEEEDDDDDDDNDGQET